MEQRVNASPQLILPRNSFQDDACVISILSRHLYEENLQIRNGSGPYGLFGIHQVMGAIISFGCNWCSNTNQMDA